MAYITTPNTFVSGATVLADALQENYQAFVTGLACGAVDVKVYDAEFTGSLTVSGNMTSTGGFNVQGEDGGGKFMVQIGCISSYVFGNAGSGYLPEVTVGETYSVWSNISQPVLMPRSGSARGFHVNYIASSTSGTGICGFQLRVNDANVASVAVYRSLTSTWVTNVTFTRDSFPFSAGKGLQTYVNEVASSVDGGLVSAKIFVEVQFD